MTRLLLRLVGHITPSYVNATFLPLVFFVFVVWVEGSDSKPAKVKGRVLEACSCMIPCACNFGGAPSPGHFCDSAAVFEFHSGQIEGVVLSKLRFAIAERGGVQASLYLEPGLPESSRKVLRKVASWILSLDRTPLVAELTKPIDIDFEQMTLRTSVGNAIRIAATPLIGNDGKSGITVSHPWIFGSFPIQSSQQYITDLLEVHAPGLSFSHKRTNGNWAVFEFSADAVDEK